MLLVAIFNAATHQFALFWGAVFHQIDQRQCGFAFAQVVTDVFANFGSVARIVQYIVNQLESSAQRAAIFAGGIDFCIGGAGNERA